jgi:hypothetical protein
VAIILPPQPWTKQPQIPVAGNRGNPITNRLRLLWNGANPNQPAFSSLAATFSSFNAPPQAAYSRGVGPALTAASSQAISTGAKIESSDGTVLLLASNCAALGGATCIAVQSINDAGSNIGLGWQGSSFFVAGASAAITTSGSDLWIAGTWGAAGIKAYVDGAVSGTNVSTVQALAPAGAYYFSLGCFDYSGGKIFHHTSSPLLFAYWDRALSASEIAALYDPQWSKSWQVFAPLPRRLFAVPAGAASNDGTLARTNANDTSAASGSVTNTGTLARTNANDTSAASGSQTNTGTLARTNANDSVSASGSTSGTNDGTLATTNANDTSAASGTQTNAGTLARTNANDGVAASGTAGTISGTVAYTNANDALTATGGGGQTRGGISRHKETKVKKSSTAVRDILRDIIDPQPAEIAQEMREAVLEASAPEVQVNAPPDEQEQEARRIARRRSVLHLLMQD